MKVDRLIPIYVEFIPPFLEEGKLYISMRFGTAVHLCPCGCQNKIVTPLNPLGWTMRFNGKISLSPSIGNYNIECQSHYYIVNNEIEWVPIVPIPDKSIKRKVKRKKLRFNKRFPFLFLT
ncbi:MAG: hypothetical protein K2I47_00785 [Odoribacter sp.]|nr:hypothetical protein [Odoribacter sp.]